MSAPARPLGPVSIVRRERLARVTSTQDVVRGWLADGEDEICAAVADEQTAGRGRLGRSWSALPGRALLVSVGLRPLGVSLERAWRLPAVVALTMLETATASLGAGASRLALKWPNDLVAVSDAGVRKIGGVLAEVEPAGQQVGSAVVGLGLNVDWPAQEFPAALAAGMGSLREAAGRPVDHERLLEAWLERLVAGYGSLLDGRFDAPAWAEAQVTTGATLAIRGPQGRLEGAGLGVDIEDGALLLRDEASGEVRRVMAGDVLSCRVSEAAQTL